MLMVLLNSVVDRGGPAAREAENQEGERRAGSDLRRYAQPQRLTEKSRGVFANEELDQQRHLADNITTRRRGNAPLIL
jgi:hypothetical protein